ncbi:hypothetical protein AB0958_21705 [Streptomyces sp. NPDC006655]|uniref:hypothetical protein n=1 Tax=Streptomyces sp. NPDC006655 TaxID=3156898 RepID=UPI00345627C6
MSGEFLGRIIGRVGSCSADMTVLELQEMWQEVMASGSSSERLLADFGSLLRDERWRAALVGQSRETATHYVWTLAAGFAGHPRLCIHEYKSRTETGSGHANTIHNHRYDFVSHILRGGYTHEDFSVEGTGRPLADWGAPSLVCTSRLAAGQGILLESHEFHRVTHIKDSTFTAVLKTASRRDHSVSFSAPDRAPARHYPLPVRARLLMKRLTLDESGAQSSGP